MAKQIPGQLNTPIPNEIGSQHSPDLAYEQTFGTEKAREQRALYALNHACNCGGKKHHKPGCPKAKRSR
jgi:hypothetical protein